MLQIPHVMFERDPGDIVHLRILFVILPESMHHIRVLLYEAITFGLTQLVWRRVEAGASPENVRAGEPKTEAQNNKRIDVLVIDKNHTKRRQGVEGARGRAACLQRSPLTILAHWALHDLLHKILGGVWPSDPPAKDDANAAPNRLGNHRHSNDPDIRRKLGVLAEKNLPPLPGFTGRRLPGHSARSTPAAPNACGRGAGDERGLQDRGPVVPDQSAERFSTTQPELLLPLALEIASPAITGARAVAVDLPVQLIVHNCRRRSRGASFHHALLHSGRLVLGLGGWILQQGLAFRQPVCHSRHHIRQPVRPAKWYSYIDESFSRACQLPGRSRGQEPAAGGPRGTTRGRANREGGTAFV
mmetsp:Transcript_11540/g.33330  ORF Transcript_11540/g.33330 Transcript_11540/m.33330 type:complete len:358 (+) Transcript_11540:469-1542(+)